MTADANKSESLLCMDKARDAIKSGDTEKARRFLQKAKKLDPSQNIDYLTKKIDEMSNNSSSQSSSRASEERSYAHDDHYEEPNLRQRHRSPTKANGKPKKEEVKPRSASRTPKLGVDYTKEQLDLVERIRHCKDYYEILKVDKKASDDDIRKEYRKMALKLHPDKCRAPHATEAFKALGNAYAVLSDATKRDQYDRYGSDAMSNGSAGTPTRHRRGNTFFEHDYAHGFEAEFTPEEIFNMFFGGGYPSEGLRRRARYQQQQQNHHHHQQYDEAHSPYGPLLQLLPLIAIMVLGLLAQIMVGEPAFSLHQTSKYNVRRTTVELRVPYFVRSDFESSYRGRVKQVEQQVEDDYIQNLRMNCYKEQNLKETKIYRARWMRDEGMMREAERTPLPSCVRLNEIYSH